MLKNHKLIIEYDGSAYHGWQRQKEDITIQAEIEKTLSIMTRQKITIHSSGRTDAGVHAYGQAAHFLCDTNLTSEIFQKGLNSLLPDDIIIRECMEVDENFHARYNAISKTYRYRILNRKLPAAIYRNYAWYIRKKLDVKKMQSAANHIIGEHDFKAFEGTGSPRVHTIRNVTTAGFSKEEDNYIVFEIKANGFLRYMVRNIVGSLVDVGLNKTTPDDFKSILLSKNRNQAGLTAPPQGLFLIKVDYI